MIRIMRERANQSENKDRIDEEKRKEIRRKLEDLAVPMDEKEYSRKEYNKLFPQGTVKTPLKEVKLGNDLFGKLGRKDNGARQSLIGALYQTLTDPVAIIKEGEDDVYLKSFKKRGEHSGQSIVLAVEKNKDTGRVIVTAYKRRQKEVENKIKMAAVIAYIKEAMATASQIKGESPILFSVSPESPEKSSDTRGNEEKICGMKR